MEATTSSILISHLRTSLPSSSFFLLTKLPHSSPKPTSLSSISLRISHHTLTLSLKSLSSRPTFQLFSSAEGVTTVEEIPEEIQENNNPKRKLFVVNIPWTFSADDLKRAFSECGTVKDAEIIRDNNGRNRGFAFVTMASGEEAQAVVDKFDNKELSGRPIKVEFARSLRKPKPQPVIEQPIKDTRHKLYVSNLQWKTRSSHLREFFSASSDPVSARVVFENASGRSAGYGFVSFNTREEAEAAISSLNGKELLGRPVQLKFSERKSEGDTAKQEEESDTAKQEEEIENQEGTVSPPIEEEVPATERKS